MLTDDVNGEGDDFSVGLAAARVGVHDGLKLAVDIDIDDG